MERRGGGWVSPVLCSTGETPWPHGATSWSIPPVQARGLHGWNHVPRFLHRWPHPRASEGHRAWRRVLVQVIGVREALGSPMPADWCPYKRRAGHKHTRRPREATRREPSTTHQETSPARPWVADVLPAGPGGDPFLSSRPVCGASCRGPCRRAQRLRLTERGTTGPTCSSLLTAGLSAAATDFLLWDPRHAPCGRKTDEDGAGGS